MKTKKHALWYYAIALALACILIYDPGRAENSSGDTISARYWPVAIIRDHTWELTPFRKELGDVGYAAIFSQDGGKLLPRNGWGMAAFTVPFYAAADLLGIGGSEWTPDRINAVSRMNAVALATLSVLVLFFFLSELFPLKVALSSSALFAFGTWNWSMGTQGLYSQTAAVLVHFISISLIWKILRSTRASRMTFLLGLLHAIIWSLRPQDVLLVAPVALVLRQRKLLTPYILGGLSLVLPLLIIYDAYYGHFLGAYGVLEAMPDSNTWRLNGLAGFLGLLFSPNRGAIVFFPLLLWVPFLWWKLMPRFDLKKAIQIDSKLAPEAALSQTLALGAALYFAALCFIVYWHGTWAYGPRYLYDLLPYVWLPITWMLHEVPRAGKPCLSRWALALCLIGALQGVAVHALGHFNYDLYVWNRYVVPVNDEKAWSFDELMLAHVWRAGSNEGRYKDGALERLKKYGF